MQACLTSTLPRSAFAPAGFAAGDQNLYRYVRNGPTNATDPSGLANVLLARGLDSKDEPKKEDPKPTVKLERKDFTKKASPATDIRGKVWGNFVLVTHFTYKTAKVGNKWEATAESGKTYIVFVLDKKETWLTAGALSQPDKVLQALIRHENIHLQMYNRVAAVATANGPSGAKSGKTATFSTEAQAKEAAEDGLYKHWDSIRKLADAAGTRLSINYDSEDESNHGKNAKQQLDWETNWKKYTDDYLVKQYKWKTEMVK